MTFALRLAGPSAQVGLDRHGSRTLSKCGSSGYDLRTFHGCCRTHDHSADVGVLLLQAAAILLVCRLVGMLAKRLGQPQVVGK